MQHQPGMAQLGGISRPTSPGASPTSPGASPPASPSVPPKRLRAPGGLKGNKRQQGGPFMAEVTGNATGHRPILTAAEVALHDKLASEYGESNHAAIAAAFTHEANLVAADMTRLLWPKFERHIKLFQRERDEQHQLKRQGLTRSVFSLIKVTVSWKLTRNHSKVLKLSRKANDCATLARGPSPAMPRRLPPYTPCHSRSCSPPWLPTPRRRLHRDS